MQPVPQAVVGAILAAGYDLRVAPHWDRSDGWTWDRANEGRHEPPTWSVALGDLDLYRPCAKVYGAASPRAGVTEAVARLTESVQRAAEGRRAEAVRARLPDRKAHLMEFSRKLGAEAAALRALAEQVAAMWPEEPSP